VNNLIGEAGNFPKKGQREKRQRVPDPGKKQIGWGGQERGCSSSGLDKKGRWNFGENNHEGRE